MAMSLLVEVFIVLLCIIDVVQCGMFKKVDNVSVVMEAEHVLADHTGINDMQCARLCNQNKRCSAFMFKAATGTCQIYSEICNSTVAMESGEETYFYHV